MSTNRYSQPSRYGTAPSRIPAPSRPGTPVRRDASTPKSSNHSPWMWAGGGLAVFGLVALAVQILQPKPPPPAPQAGCVIGIDAQGSASTMVDAYRRWLPSEAKGCAASERARLDLALISGETQTSTVTPIETNLSTLKYIDHTGDPTNDATIDDKNKAITDRQIDRVVGQADKAILAAPRQQGGTDILGMICVAHDLLKDDDGSKTLIVNTDGMNNRQPYILSKVPLDQSHIAKYVDQLKSSGQLCSLDDTNVYMYGAGIGSGTNKLASSRLIAVHNFWTATFQAAGAQLVSYQRNP